MMPAEDAAEDRHADEQEDRDRLEVEAAAPASRGARRPARRRRCRQAFAGDPLAEPVDRAVQAAGVVAGAKRRHDLLADDPAGGDVGNRALQGLGDLDLHRAVVLRDDQEQAVADVLAADLPLLADALRERGDVLRRGRRHDQDHDLRAVRGLDRGQLVRERLGLRRRQRSGLVDHPAGERRHRQHVLRRRQAGGDAEQDGSDEGAHRRTRWRDEGGDQRGAEAALSKLTLGGTEIWASFWTVKLGLTL